MEQVRNLKRGSAAMVKRWLDNYGPKAERLYHEAKYPAAQYKLLRDSMQLVAGQTPLVLSGAGSASVRNLPLAPKDEFAIFLRIDPPAGAKVGAAYEFDVVQFDAKTNSRLGGSRYRVVINRKAKSS
jgi:hypothetical protein